MKTKSEDTLMSNMIVLLAHKEQRDGRRYKQKEIAEETGLSESMISRFMAGKGIEGADYLFRITGDETTI